MIEGNVHPNPSQPYDASSPADVEKRKVEALRREKESREVVVNLLQTRAGRAWMFSILEVGHIYQTSFGPDALTTAFREGERNLALKLLAQITAASPDGLIAMMTENANG